MVDFVKFVVKDGSHLLDNGLLEFQRGVNVKIGELNPYQLAEYKDMKFKLYGHSLLIVTGSLHKCYNNGEHNHNDFTFTNLVKVLNEFEQLFKIDLNQSQLQNLEFGVNVLVWFNVRELLDNCLFQGSSSFDTGHDGHYKQIKKSEMYFKLYDKGSQYKVKNNGVDVNLMRYELKCIKSRMFNKFGVYTLADLKKDDWQIPVLQELLKEWEKFYFFDFTTQQHDLENTQILNWQIISYWNRLKSMSRMREKTKFRQYMKAQSQNNFEKLKIEIENKWFQLSFS